MNFSIVISCPHTKIDVSTGLTVDIRTFAGMPRGVSSVRCSACGHIHHWTTADAMLAAILPADAATALADTPPPPRQAV